MEKKYSVYIVDDHKMITDGLNSFFLDTEKYIVKGTFHDGITTMTAIKNNVPDILITDIKMPGITGIELIKEIKKDYYNIKILVLSMYNESHMVRDISEAGADGYILKNTGKEELFRALEALIHGKKYYCEEVLSTLFNRLSRKQVNSGHFSQLTFREKDIIKLLVEGKTSVQISDELHISHYTVDTHRKNIMRKTGSHNIAELIHWTINNELL